MIINIKKDGNVVINQKDIIITREHQLCYGVPLTSVLGLRFGSFSVEVGEVYKVLDDETEEELEAVLFSIHIEEIGSEKYKYYTFIKKEYSDILKNKVDINTNIDTVSFKNYTILNNNQLSYFIFELRKKGVVQTLKNKMEKQLHITDILHQEPIVLKKSMTIKKIENFQLKANNYYTILDDGTVKKTNNGKDLHRYLPFAKEFEIQGLDGYIIPKYEMNSTENINELVIGNLYKYNDEKCIVIEKEVFMKGRNIVTFIVLGVLV